jgi:hypothetical protein
MPVCVEFLLFFEPESEFTEKDIANPVKFRRKVVALYGHLKAVAKAVDKLHKAGWDAVRGMYDICFYPDEEYTPAKARKRLRQLGINPSLACIEELEVEGDEMEVGEDADDVVRAGQA